MAELLCERITGQQTEKYTSPEMIWGTEHEAEAREAYENATFYKVELAGFIDVPGMMAGCSPDGLVNLMDHSGLIEIKCLSTANHIDTLLTETIDGRYIKQMQWQMFCTGREWCDFVSYDPRSPEPMRLWIKRVNRDDAMIDEMVAEVNKFLKELDEMERAVRLKYNM
jgi:hypothetical protein